MQDKRFTSPTDDTQRKVIFLDIDGVMQPQISIHMDLYEQQSTYNPNMPLRMLQYAGITEAAFQQKMTAK